MTLHAERASPEGTAQRCALPADVGVLAASLGALRLALAGGAHGFPAKGSPPRAEPVLALHAAASAAPAACEAGAAEAGAPAPPLPVRPRRRGRRLLRCAGLSCTGQDLRSSGPDPERAGGRWGARH